MIEGSMKNNYCKTIINKRISTEKNRKTIRYTQKEERKKYKSVYII